jgi:cobalt-zinc-cadmium efflux system outer membrane protein
MRASWVVGAIAGLMYGGAVARAEGQTLDPAGGEMTAPTVDALVARALSRAPSLAAQRERLSAATALVEAATALPDPVVEFEYRSAGFPRYTIGSDPMSMAGAAVRQPLLTRGRRDARHSLAVALVGQRHAQTDNVACDLIMAVREQYARLYELDREEETLADAQQIADLLIATASSRYAAGTADQAAVLRAQLERTRLGERQADLRTERRIAAAVLNRLTNDPPDTPIGRVRTLPDLGPPPAAIGGVSLPEVASGMAPEIAVRKATIDVAGREVEAARQELHSSLTVGAGLYWQGGLDRTAVFTVGVDLPFWKTHKQLPMLAAAEHELQAARADLETSAAEARTEVATLVAEWQLADEQLARYRTAILPQSSATFDATRVSYLGGRADFAALAEEFRRWMEVRVEVARREAARYSARARLDIMLAPPEHGTWGQPAMPGHKGTDMTVGKERQP